MQKNNADRKRLNSPSFGRRPRLIVSIVVALLVAAILTIWEGKLATTTRVILAWNAGVLCFLLLIYQMMSGCGVTCIRVRAETQDEGRGLVLGLSILAATAAVLAIGLELGLAKHVHGIERTMRVVLAFTTMALSWVFMHIIFALHYAHEYYAPDKTEEGEAVRCGLHFPGGQPPDYWDFVYFALTIGVANQTGDVPFTSRAQRRIGTLHSVVSFVFNTMILALTINLLAGLF